jgi:hypothetical protein
VAKEEVQEKADVLVAAMFKVMVVRLADGKKQPVEVRFAEKPLGFSCGKPSVGCCGGKAPERKVIVKTVEKGKQAAKLEVMKGWSMDLLISERRAATSLAAVAETSCRRLARSLRNATARANYYERLYRRTARLAPLPTLERILAGQAGYIRLPATDSEGGEEEGIDDGLSD